MKTSIIVVLTTTALMGLTACDMHSSSPKDLPPGTYVDKAEHTDRDGTNVEAKKTTQVGYDEYGNKTAVVKTKTTTDPKGLFNKETTRSTTVVK